MAKRLPTPNENLLNVEANRHEDTRKNLPLAKIAAEGKLEKTPKQTYSYSPRFDPLLRFDDTKRLDTIAKLSPIQVVESLMTKRGRFLRTL